MAALRCRPGDLAYIASLHPAAGLNGQVVRLKHQSPSYIDGVAYWYVERPIRVLSAIPLRIAGDRRVGANEIVEFDGFADHVLRPIRGVGDHEVDEMVRKIGAAPRTLTEVLEASHG